MPAPPPESLPAMVSAILMVPGSDPGSDPGESSGATAPDQPPKAGKDSRSGRNLDQVGNDERVDASHYGRGHADGCAAADRAREEPQPERAAGVDDDQPRGHRDHGREIAPIEAALRQPARQEGSQRIREQ